MDKLKVGDKCFITESNIPLPDEYLSKVGQVIEVANNNYEYPYRVEIIGTNLSVWCRATRAPEFNFSVSEFEKIVDELKELHKNKNHDYAGDNYLSNLTASARLGIPEWVGVAVRLQDKMSRIENFAKQGELHVKDESVEDTLKDIAVYSILGLILFRKKVNGSKTI